MPATAIQLGAVSRQGAASTPTGPGIQPSGTATAQVVVLASNASTSNPGGSSSTMSTVSTTNTGSGTAAAQAASATSHALVPFHGQPSTTPCGHPVVRFLLATWLGNLIGGVALIVAVASAIYSAYVSAASLRLARWSATVDAIQGCTALVGLGLSTAYCNETLNAGVSAPPIKKRSWPESSEPVLHNLSMAVLVSVLTYIFALAIGTILLAYHTRDIVLDHDPNLLLAKMGPQQHLLECVRFLVQEQLVQGEYLLHQYGLGLLQSIGHLFKASNESTSVLLGPSYESDDEFGPVADEDEDKDEDEEEEEAKVELQDYNQNDESIQDVSDLIHPDNFRDVVKNFSRSTFSATNTFVALIHPQQFLDDLTYFWQAANRRRSTLLWDPLDLEHATPSNVCRLLYITHEEILRTSRSNQPRRAFWMSQSTIDVRLSCMSAIISLQPDQEIHGLVHEILSKAKEPRYEVTSLREGRGAHYSLVASMCGETARSPLSKWRESMGRLRESLQQQRKLGNLSPIANNTVSTLDDITRSRFLWLSSHVALEVERRQLAPDAARDGSGDIGHFSDLPSECLYRLAQEVVLRHEARPFDIGSAAVRQRSLLPYRKLIMSPLEEEDHLKITWSATLANALK